MAIFLPVLITPLAVSDLKNNQHFIDIANKKNEGKSDDDVTRERVPDPEHWFNLTYLAVQEEMIGGMPVETRYRTDCKFYGSTKPKIGVPSFFQAKLVEYQSGEGNSKRAAMSYKLMKILTPQEAGLPKTQKD